MSYHRSRRVSKDYAYYELKQQIINGELEPEQILIEDGLAGELGISKTPPREALQKLELEELVIRQANGRLRVASISVQEVGEIFLVRSYLEGIVAKQATENATQEDFEKLADISSKIMFASEAGQEDEVVFYGSEFHSYLYELSNNRTAMKLLGMLNDHISRYRRLVPSLRQAKIENEIEDHARILVYMRERDAKGAEAAMREHVISSMHIAIKAIEKYQEL